MEVISSDEFFRLIAAKGIKLDSKYCVPSFSAGSESRFWCTPPGAGQRPYFINSLIKLWGDWNYCHVWRRDRWADDRTNPFIHDLVERKLLQGLGVPLGRHGVLKYCCAEFDALLTLLFVSTVFGGSAGEDLYIVPDHARQIMVVSHHDVIHIEFSYETDVESWVKGMEAEGFKLPNEVPDWTFIRPSWMRDDSG